MVSIGSIVDLLGAQDRLRCFTEESLHIPIVRPAPIAHAQPGDISFCGATARNPQELLSNTRASLLIVDQNIPIDEASLTRAGVQAVIRTNNARLDFIRVVTKLFARPHPQGVHPTAVVSPLAKVDPSSYIGPLCSVGDAEIGEGTLIHAGVHIYDGVRIGRNVIIHSGTVVGADGFGYERNEQGGWEKFPHLGGVVIEDDVEIGANSCIDRGTLGDTRICEGCRIDDIVYIAHNVYIGKQTVVIAHSMVAGGTHIGNASWVAPCACLRDRIQIGDEVTIGIGAVVTKDVPSKTTVLGVPARSLEEHNRLLQKLSSLLGNSIG